MRKATILLVAIAALVAVLALPSMAYGVLVNEYGMKFAGQDKCLECHDGVKAATVHGRFAKVGLVPDAPAGWTVFQAAGDLPPVAGTPPAVWTSGGRYAIAQPWITLGDFQGGAATEYLFWKGSADPLINPWNLVEGLIAEPPHEWLVGSEDPTRGLYDVQYRCQRCHMLGTTLPTASAAATSVVPNPQVSIEATYTTGRTWARDESKTVADFDTDPTVSYPGMSIQCEACHGTGFGSTLASTKHWNSGTQLSHRMPEALQGGAGATTVSTLGNSQVCGQCHGSYGNVAGTLGIYGYTPNLPLRDFVNINSGTYTYTPTEAEFLAAPTTYYLFPNGSNARGNHYYYNEWSTSAHAYRGAYFNAGTGHSEDPDALVGGLSGHYNATTSGLDCAECHTGEGYLKTKGVGVFADMTLTNANTGFMGQECVVCHEAHPAGVGMESNIRPPDAAGVRSNAANANIVAAGLPANTTANASMCEDCHNWQLEVQGTVPSIKPQASLASRGGPSHPQRETLHGRVMLEVPAVGEFMPGATCQECHMPKTDRRARRYSHGMHIMRPGDAETWQAAAGYTAGEDSCSNCHPGLTRAELEDFLAGWQADTTAALTAAHDAIVAAQTGGFAEYSLTTATAPGYILVGKATWNYKAVGSDGSVGAHNPMYAVAGLNKATQMAKSVGGSFNAVFASSSISAGNLGFIAGKVVNGDGTGAAGAKLTLIGGGGGTTMSDANGNFSFMVAPGATTAYQVRWERSSSSPTWLLSETKTIAVVGGGEVTPPPGGPIVTVYRFYNLNTKSHFYTASEAEKATVMATLSAVLRYEGPAYWLNTADPTMNVTLWRFYNRSTGAHFYTVSETEKATLMSAGNSVIWQFDGPAYQVSMTPGAPVYRFYNITNGTHFYTASEAEKNTVITTMSATYRYEGPAFYLAPL